MRNQDLSHAKQMLNDSNYTCVLCKDEETHNATARGVKPLVQWLHSGQDLSGFSAADKVVGKATAFLYCLLGVNAVFAHVMSQSALDVLQKQGIYAEFDTLVPHIINRKGDGICPFEEAVLSIKDPDTALTAIHSKMQEMGIPVD